MQITVCFDSLIMYLNNIIKKKLLKRTKVGHGSL